MFTVILSAKLLLCILGVRNTLFILVGCLWKKKKDIRTADNGAQIDRKLATIIRRRPWLSSDLLAKSETKIACVKTYSSDEMNDLA